MSPRIVPLLATDVLLAGLEPRRVVRAQELGALVTRERCYLDRSVAFAMNRTLYVYMLSTLSTASQAASESRRKGSVALSEKATGK